MGNEDQRGAENSSVDAPDDLLFPPVADGASISAEPGVSGAEALEPWLILVVDDDPDVHTITRHVLSDLRFENRPVAFESVYSAIEARERLLARPDTAVVLLDVIMETDEAGLALVHFVRDELQNSAVRILLRTGQPNMFPEREIALEHDVNDYLSKNQTTADRLFTATVTALRGYRQIREREEAERRLIQAEKMEALGGLAGGIAHDFNNILATVIGAAEVARDELEPEHAATFYLRTILSAGKRGRQIVRQILTFSRPSQHAMRPIDLGRLVRETLDLVGQNLPENIVVTSEIQDANLWIMADSGQLHQVVTNLCVNAGQAMRGGGRLTVTVAGPATGAPNQTVVLTIADTGSGIPLEHRNRIFEPFFTTKRGEKGTGLGLAVVHGIVRAHNAEISVTTSTAAEGMATGTTFTVRFPSVEAPVGAAADAPEPEATPLGRGQPVLIVEDEAELLAVVRSVVVSLGYAPECHGRAREALAAFQARPGHYRLVLTDHLMPDMTGAALAEQVAMSENRVPVVLMSGDPQDDGDGRFAAVLEKPLFREELGLVLAELVS